jgi:hypothetical protein
MLALQQVTDRLLQSERTRRRQFGLQVFNIGLSLFKSLRARIIV